MVRFLHIADMQIGMKAQDAGEVGERLRDARFEALKACVELGRSEKVDFIVIAGDLFESNQVSAHTVSRTTQMLQQADPIPVYILPGNHDWLDAGSVYARSEFAPNAARNVTVLRDREPVEVADDCVLYPCPITRRWDLADPTDWIPVRESDQLIRIGVAHGSLPSPDSEREFPIELGTPQKKGLDYLALGDWHGLRMYDGARLAYPGTPEQTRFGEKGAGQALVVEIQRAGHPPELTPHPVGTLVWEQWDEQVIAPADDALQRLRERIEQLPRGPSTLVRLRLTGALRADELPLVDQFETWGQARCDNGQLLHLDLQCELQTIEALEGALRDLVESDEVVAGAAADLRAMASVAQGGTTEIDGVQSRGMDELIATWGRTDPADQEMSVVAGEALKLLATLAGEMS